MKTVKQLLNEVDTKKLAATNADLEARGFAPRSYSQQHMLDTQGHLYRKPSLPKVTASGVEAPKLMDKVARHIKAKIAAKKPKETLKRIAIKSFIKGIVSG